MKKIPIVHFKIKSSIKELIKKIKEIKTKITAKTGTEYKFKKKI